MNLFTETIAWFADPAHWTGPSGIPTRTAQHIAITILVTLITVVVAVPLGAWMGHSHRGQATIAAAANATRALPTLGLVTLLALWLGIGLGAPMIALVILAIPSVLAATYAGVANVPGAIQAQYASEIALGFAGQDSFLSLDPHRIFLQHLVAAIDTLSLGGLGRPGAEIFL